MSTGNTKKKMYKTFAAITELFQTSPFTRLPWTRAQSHTNGMPSFHLKFLGIVVAMCLYWSVYLFFQLMGIIRHDAESRNCSTSQVLISLCRFNLSFDKGKVKGESTKDPMRKIAIPSNV